MSDFKSMDLLPAIQNAILKKGYTTPTPIQAKSIPHLLKGKDILGIAQTGTGKTAAFSLPILNRLAKNKVQTKRGNARTLILTPTRELASQIEQNVREYGKGLKLVSTVIFGGVGHTPQIRKMNQGVDILIATPGRLLDLMNDGHIRYEQLEVFVLDEADRMLDMGFIHDVKKIIAKLPKNKQTLLFSATMPKDIATLASSLLKNPVRCEVAPESTTVEKIDQSICMVEKANKTHLLKEILTKKEIKSTLIFSRTKHGADRIVKFLDREGIDSVAIHGNKAQGARERALNSFRSGKVKILIATDIAARGIDVSHVTHVINFDLPDDPKSYVHRIGRTARAGKEGVAISFCGPTEVKLLKAIEKNIKAKVFIDKTHSFHIHFTKKMIDDSTAKKKAAKQANSGRPKKKMQSKKTQKKNSSDKRKANSKLANKNKKVKRPQRSARR